MSNKEVIENMYKEFFNGHDISAATKYVREDYIQHNPEFGQGRQDLMDGFVKMFERNPTFHVDIQMMVEEGDFVFVYLKAKGPDGKTTVGRVVDMYRLKDGKLAEHWDVLQPVSDEKAKL